MMIVVELTNFKISEFLVKKSELPERACNAQTQVRRVKVKCVRLDDAGGNKAFATLANSKDWDLQLKFEFTGVHTAEKLLG
jgi:hypothetical protein